jgi:non-canonical purine NTP pyrophosphatase (RdgB/HAM1 family)
MDIYFITKNPGKLATAQSIFQTTDFNLLMPPRDYPEIQADTSLEIARVAAIECAKDIGLPAIREDHSLYINALGIPGPYVNFFEKELSAKELLRLLSLYDDRSGYFEIAMVYAEPSGLTHEYVYQVPVYIATEERGSLQNGWARVLCLEGDSRTFAEYPEDERIEVWNKNFKRLFLDLS